MNQNLPTPKDPQLNDSFKKKIQIREKITNKLKIDDSFSTRVDQIRLREI